MRNPLLTLLSVPCALLLLLMAPGASHGSQQHTALDSEGRLYTVIAGTYSELFPGGGEALLHSSVLALDILYADGTAERLLVPGTTGNDNAVESAPSLLYEDTSGTLFLVWESRRSYIHPTLNLTSFDGDGWSEVIQVTSNQFALKGSPQLLVTHDSYEVPGAEGSEPTSVSRTVIHVLWWEEGIAGYDDTLYSPIVLLDGRFTGETPVYRLNDFDTAEVAIDGAVPRQELVRSPTLVAGQDAESITAGFVSPANNRLITLEMRVLPGELSQLAGDARLHIVDIGRHLQTFSLRSLGNAARNYILQADVNLHTAVRQYLATEVRAFILDSGMGRDELEELADAAREHLLVTAASLAHSGLRNLSGPARLHIVDIGRYSTAAGMEESPQVFDARVVTDRALPEIGDGPATIHVSPDGERVIVSWQENPDYLHYRESVGEGWGPPRNLKLSEDLTVERAREILSQRVRAR